MFLRKSVRRARGSSGAAPRVSGLSPEPLESRRLFAAIVEEARARRLGDLVLWVFDGNRRARRFYERAGMTFDGTVVSHPRFRVPLLRYAMEVER